MEHIIFLYSIFLEHYFNIWEHYNIPRNFIGNFFRIYREHSMGMFHEYSMNIYLPGNLNCLTVRKDKSTHFD